ncbi:hypothetical protein GCM10009759_70060 [Kitasatospora saccharophila]|uniref:DUF485 domain-containing protein n=1 Tax=Kitasatospora saccharophila TaxID=407973 RepID=A0ABN2Y2K8_9ACTN
MTAPHQGPAGEFFRRPPTSYTAPAAPPDPTHLLAAANGLSRRHGGRLLTGYLLFAATVSAAPSALHHRITGHVSPALVLLLLQLALVVWTLVGHHRGAARLESDIENHRTADGPWSVS